MKYEAQEAPENYADMEDKVYILTSSGKAEEMEVPDDACND